MPNASHASEVPKEITEELIQLRAENKALQDDYQKLMLISARGHRQAAIFASATTSLAKMLGEKALQDAGIDLPEKAYLRTFAKMLMESHAESQAQTETS